MNQEIKRKWLKALRSGEHRQGRNIMVNLNGGMCCLAVLRHVVDPEDRKSRDGYNQMPTCELLDRVGLSDDAAVILAALNDGSNGYRAHTFPEIADYIEANL